MPAIQAPKSQEGTPSVLRRGISLVRALLLGRRYFWHLTLLLLAGEAVLGLLIIWKVPYTKIDWDAYMQQVQLFRDGERDYSLLLGETGPCVYPALHLYIYTALQSLLPGSVSSDRQVRAGQYVFLGFYLVTLSLVALIYYLAGEPLATSAERANGGRGSEVKEDIAATAAAVAVAARSSSPTYHPFPQVLLIPLTLSKRLHSIYMLRLFNDPFAMVLLYASVLAMMAGRYREWGFSWGCRLFSLALGVKMNILLFVPGLLVLLVQYRGVLKTLRHVVDIVLIQFLLPATYFLSTRAHTIAYWTSAFNLSREFLYKWTVNWRMMSEERFLSTQTSTGLLGVHVILLILFALFVWAPVKRGNLDVAINALKAPWRAPVIPASLPAYHIPLVLFTSNLIGITCARSLHYQFQSWYFHQIPFLLAAAGLLGRWTAPAGITMLLATEYAWLKFPSTTLSSSVLLGVNSTIILGLFAGRGRPSQQVMRALLLAGVVAVPVAYIVLPEEQRVVLQGLLPK